ncbi:MAG: MFS transporter [Acidimicrobiales bacterium]
MLTDGRPRASRSIVALLASSFLSVTAALVATTALGKLVYDITRSELALGLLGLAEFAPAAVLVLVTGPVADRYDRRTVAALGIGVEALAALGLIALVATGPKTALPIFAFVLVFGVGRAFANPAARSLPADIVDADRLPWLTARYTATWQTAMIAGPVLGGMLYAIDETAPFMAMFALLIVAALSVRLVRVERTVPAADLPAARTALEPIAEAVSGIPPEPPERAGLHEAMAGLRFIRNQPVLLGAISLDLFAVLFGGAVALLPAIAEERLHVDAVAYGWLRAAGGIGAALVTIALARRPLTRRVGPTLLCVVALFGVGTIVLGVTRSYVVAFLAMIVLSGADAVSVFVRATLVPLVTPDDKRGRVLAVENVFIGASNELGAFESGVAGQAIGPAGAVVLGGVATLAIAVGWWVLFPALRKVDRFPDAPPR